MSLRPLHSIDEVAAYLGVDRDAVSRFIANRELAAIDVTRSRSAKRPTWRISDEALAAFEAARASTKVPAISAQARAKRTKKSSGKTWF